MKRSHQTIGGLAANASELASDGALGCAAPPPQAGAGAQSKQRSALSGNTSHTLAKVAQVLQAFSLNMYIQEDPREFVYGCEDGGG